MGTQWFYDTSTGQVQELERKGQAKDLLGPYASREEAEQALARAHARTEENDRRDREEDDW
ncbi:SPOR domain-containing protein [Kineococcus sp. SYSU DK002]|uniref:SPOR domain-containing protein n=1 Tax=Kineococcus sp. SYSU DK002 TaxID=3383123 RepID=UPI003D7C8023